MDLDSCPGSCEDTDLVQRLARGDSAAFKAIVAKYQAAMASLVFRLLAGSHDVDDIVQEVFLSALQHLPNFRGQSSLSTWLTRIAINKCRSHRRRQWLSFDLLFRREGSRDRRDAAGGQSEAAEVPLLDAERLGAIRSAINRLPGRDREVIVLRYLQQLPLEEISELLDVRVETIRARLHRGRAKLKEMLKGLLKD